MPPKPKDFLNAEKAIAEVMARFRRDNGLPDKEGSSPRQGRGRNFTVTSQTTEAEAAREAATPMPAAEAEAVSASEREEMQTPALRSDACWQGERSDTATPASAERKGSVRDDDWCAVFAGGDAFAQTPTGSSAASVKSEESETTDLLGRPALKEEQLPQRGLLPTPQRQTGTHESSPPGGFYGPEYRKKVTTRVLGRVTDGSGCAVGGDNPGGGFASSRFTNRGSGPAAAK